HDAWHSALTCGGVTWPVQRGSVNCTEHWPRHSPWQLACASATQCPSQLPVQPAEHVPWQVPVQRPLHWPSAPCVAQRPSQAPWQTPVQPPEHVPSHAAEHEPWTSAEQCPLHSPEQPPRISPPSHWICAEPGVYDASQCAAQSAYASMLTSHTGGVTTSEIVS